MPVKKPVRTRLVEERKRRGWSQQALADHLGTTRINISRWEAGFTTPGPYLRTKLCKLFGMSAYELGLLDTHQPPSGKREVDTENISAPQREALALWTVPYLRNPHFTGREELLEHLDQHFSVSRDGTTVSLQQAALTQPQAIKGLGGIGKTQIAVEYAYRAREQGRYTHILWINAANEEAIMTSFVALAEMIPVVIATNETDQQKLVTAIIRWLQHCNECWLLIFDNADDVTLLESYLPRQGKGDLLFTTRAHAVGSCASSMEVEKMGLVEGTMLLLHRAQRRQDCDDERNEATNIVIALDGFPLALDQAGAYIEETGCSFSTYLQLYQNHRSVLLARRGKQATHYPDSVATTWSLSFQKVEQASPAAAELLRLCAFLAPDGIPEEVLTHGALYWPPFLQQAVTDPFLFNQMIERVLTFSLVKRLTSNRLLSIHRLVQAVIVDALEREEQVLWVRRAVQGVNEVFPRSVTATTWSYCQRYLSQAQQCTLWIEKYACLFEEAASLLFRTASFLYDRSLYSPAGLLFQQARTIWEQVLGPEHPDVAASLYWLAIVYVREAKFEQAELLHRRALHIREQVLGPEHPDVAASLYRLAIVYAVQEKDEQAELLLQRALHIWEQKRGSKHLDSAGALDSLAVISTRQNKDKQAEALFQQALHIREQVLGPHHPDVAASLNNLSSFFLDQGKYEQAELLGNRALHIWEQSVGPEHSYVAYPLANLAELSAKQGKYAQSEVFYQRALCIWEQSLGVEHPEVAIPLNGLANLYREQDRYAEAEPLYQRALHIREQQLGSDHPDTAATLHDLATFREQQRCHQEALALYERALAIRDQALGPDHPRTRATRERLTALRKRSGHEGDAPAEDDLSPQQGGQST